MQSKARRLIRGAALCVVLRMSAPREAFRIRAYRNTVIPTGAKRKGGITRAIPTAFYDCTSSPLRLTRRHKPFVCKEKRSVGCKGDPSAYGVRDDDVSTKPIRELL